MKIIALSDLHGNLPKDIPDCKLLIIAGDICPHFAKKAGSEADKAGQFDWLDTKFRAWLEDRPGTMEVVGIWGNHDFVGLGEIPKHLPWTLLQDEEVYLAKHRIYGTPYTNRFYDWAFMENEKRLTERFAKIPEGIDILVSHGPPKWCCDRLEYGDRVGSEALYQRLLVMKDPPKDIICGHIHTAKGSGAVPHSNHDIRVWNVSSVDDHYEPHSPMWTEINPPLDVVD
jgi:Icc-related predicted phosphoesterase